MPMSKNPCNMSLSKFIGPQIIILLHITAIVDHFAYKEYESIGNLFLLREIC